MKFSLISAVLAAAALFTVAAQAVDSNYFGANIGTSETKYTTDDFGSRSNNETGGKFYYGHKFSPMWGIETGIATMGKDKQGSGAFTASLEPRALYVAATGTWSFGRVFALTAKAGVSHNQVKFSSSFEADDSDDTVSPMIGVGAVFKLNDSIALVVEHEYFGDMIKEDGGKVRSQLLSAGVRFSF